jgi:hypothetical protein
VVRCRRDQLEYEGYPAQRVDPCIQKKIGNNKGHKTHTKRLSFYKKWGFSSLININVFVEEYIEANKNKLTNII